MAIKVCGMRDGENIRAAEALGLQWMGFICWNGSARCVTATPTYLPETCRRVGVFVNPDTEYVRQKADELRLQCLQLHGQETPSQCSSLHRLTGLPVIKAIPVAGAEDIARARIYNNVEGVDMLLFDTRSDAVGGSGRSFDWTLLHDYDGDTPFLLSGGIGPQDAARIRQFRHPCLAGIDLNSRFETAPGVKDIDTLRIFINEIRKP
ncbi:MAG: phosphoribosylanthranilate isomerase [Bacteroidaceae bacterium]|nr:phosphoribosylanthranilate isomerase [Bacteroidaceae bacterium]